MGFRNPTSPNKIWGCILFLLIFRGISYQWDIILAWKIIKAYQSMSPLDICYFQWLIILLLSSWIMLNLFNSDSSLANSACTFSHFLEKWGIVIERLTFGWWLVWSSRIEIKGCFIKLATNNWLPKLLLSLSLKSLIISNYPKSCDPSSHGLQV